MNKLIEDIVICVVLALGLSIACFFLIQMVEYDKAYPPTAVSAFLGIAVAALTYRFLGGTADASVSFGFLKIGGAAALFFGISYFVGQWIAHDQKLYEDFGSYRKELEAKEHELGDKADEITKKNTRMRELEKQLLQAPDAQRTLTLAEIRKLSPNDPLVKEIKQLVLGQEPPFAETLNGMTVGITVAAMNDRIPLYRICPETLSQLRGQSTVINTKVKLSRSTDSLGEPFEIMADRNGTIGADICDREGKDFSVQINCKAALALFPDKITACSESGVLRGGKVTISSLPL